MDLDAINMIVNELQRIRAQQEQLLSESHARTCLEFFGLTGDQRYLEEARRYMKLYTNSNVNDTQSTFGTNGGSSK